MIVVRGQGVNHTGEAIIVKGSDVFGLTLKIGIRVFPDPSQCIKLRISDNGHYTRPGPRHLVSPSYPIKRGLSIMIENRWPSLNILLLLYILRGGIPKVEILVRGRSPIGSVLSSPPPKTIIRVIDRIARPLKMGWYELLEVSCARILLCRGLMTKTVYCLIDMGLGGIIVDGCYVSSWICNLPKSLVSSIILIGNNGILSRISSG